MRYGKSISSRTFDSESNGKHAFNYKVVKGPFTCNSDTFGGDPKARGIVVNACCGTHTRTQKNDRASLQMNESV